jgi:uncharacterized protein (TIGR03083 family)
MTATLSTGTQAKPRSSALERTLAMRLAAQEYQQFLGALRGLGATDWQRSTECPGWDVHAMSGHVLGMAEMAGSLVEQVRQMRRALKGDVFIDTLTALQVAKHSATSNEQIVTRYAAVAPKAAKGRRRTPRLVRGRTLPVQQGVGGTMEDWTFGFLVDVILTRDTWMHRLDLSRAVGTEPVLTAGHDGAIVADVVAEWAGRHGQACSLTLTGPAGGSWTFGAGGPALDLDALEYCRLISGRGEGAGLLSVQVPF